MLRKIKKWWVLSLYHTVLPVVLTFLLFILSYFYILIPALEENIVKNKRQTIKELTSSVCHLLEEYDGRYQAGELTLDEAQARAKSRVRAMRYGPEDKDYFWISDSYPKMVMHPYRLEMEGQDLSRYTDQRGDTIFSEMVDVVSDSGSGYLDYIWQWKSSPYRMGPKVSYVQYFRPWGWIVGTGVYMDDVGLSIDAITKPLKHTYAIILIVLTIVSIYMIVQSGKIENQRHTAIKRLQESEKKFKMIFNSVFHHIGLLDADGRIIEMNQTTLNFIKKDNGAIKGRLLWEAPWWNFSSENQIQLKEALIQCKEKSFVRFQAQNKFEEDVVDVDVSMKAILDDMGKIQLIISEMLDISEQKETEREMQALIEALEAQKEELERFTYTVSHDLKSPLITIKGFLSLLEKDVQDKDEEQARHDMKRIYDAVNKMEMLLRDLLELSRIGRMMNDPEKISLSTLIKEAQEMAAGQLEEKQVTLKIHEPLPHVYGDLVRLREVLVNLLANAAKFMGGQETPIIEVGYTMKGEQPCIYVKDNGIGIKPEYGEKIFGLFEKLDQSYEGTGIGLAIVKRIVEIHGGRIWVESGGPGMGSTFCFTLNGIS